MIFGEALNVFIGRLSLTGPYEFALVVREVPEQNTLVLLNSKPFECYLLD